MYAMERLSSDTHPNLSDEVIVALHKNKIFIVEDFINTDTQKLSLTSRLVFKDVLDIKNDLIKQYSAKLENAFNIYNSLLQNSTIISSGIKEVDEILEGGFFTGNIYEICGRAGAGKSSLALTIAKNVTHYMKQYSYYLDTKNDFSARKYKYLLKEFTNEEIVDDMERLLVKQITNKFELINSLFHMKCQLEEGHQLRLVIIDSLAAIFTQNKNLSANNLLLSHVASIMRYIANKYHVAFVVVNLLNLWNDGDFKKQGESKEIITCGKYWIGIPDTRLKMEVIENKDTYRISVVKSNTLLLKSIEFPKNNLN